MQGFSHIHRHEIYLINQYILAWEQFFKEPGKCQFHEFSYLLNHNSGGALTKDTYSETIEEMKKCLSKIIRNPEFSDCDSEYKTFIYIANDKIVGHLEYMNDQFPRWSDEELSACDSQTIMRVVMQDMKRIQKKFSSIEKYYLKVLEIKPYLGRSKIQKLADRM